MSWSREKIARLAGRLLIILGGLLLLVSATLTLLLTTESGSRTLVNYGIERINQQESLAVQAGSVSGTFYSGLNFTELELLHSIVHLQADSLSTSWNFWNLLRGNLTVDGLFLTELHLSLPETGATSSEATDSANMALPRIVLPRVEVRGFSNDIDSRLDAERIAAGVLIEGQEIAIEELDFNSSIAGAQANINISLEAALNVAVEANWQLAENFVSGMPALSGNTNLRGNSNELQVQQTLLPPYNIVSEGMVRNLSNMDAMTFDLVHDINLASLPQFPAPLQSVLLNLQSRGAISDIVLEAGGIMEFTELADHQLEFRGRWSGQGLALERFELQQGQTVLRSTLNLSDAMEVTGQFDLQAFDPVDYLPGQAGINLLPMEINAQAELDVQNLTTNPSATATIQNLRILAQENEISGSGEAEFSEAGLFISDFQLDSDTTHLTLDGAIGSSNDLAWQLEIEDVGQFAAEATGTVIGEGRLSGSQQEPFATGSLRMDDFSLGPVKAGSFAAEIQGSPVDYQADISLQNFAIETTAVMETVESGEIQIDGNPDSFTLTLDTQSEQGSVSLLLEGGPLQQSPLLWEGELVRAELVADRQWNLANPAELRLSQMQQSLGNACLNSAGTELCIALELSADGGDLEASLEDYPLQGIPAINQAFPFLTLQSLPALDLPQGVSFRGDLDGSLSANFLVNEPLDVALSLSSAGPVMSMPIASGLDAADLDNTRASGREYRWRDVSLAGQLEDESWSFLVSGALLEQSIDDVVSPLQGDIEVVIGISADQMLSGSSRANFDELGWLEVYLPDLSNIRGELRSDLQLQGSLQEPRLSGFFKVSEAGFFLDRWGVRIDQFSGELDAADNGDVSFNAMARTEDGELILEGSATNLLAADSVVEMNLRGEEFQLLDSEELSVRVSPDLSLLASSERIAVTGSILLPQLLIAMDSLPESAIDVSSDVVIVNYSPDESGVVNSLAAENARFLNIPVTAEVDIALGENVRFQGLGLSTTLAGELEMELLENGSNRTFGELSIIEGSYTLYGQSLQIDEGELLFIGPYDNPGLDIVATRRVNEQVVGVQMNGTLRNLQSELISTPNLPEAEVIALITTGRPFSELGNTDEAALLGSIARLGLERGRAISERVRTSMGLDTLAITNTGNINNSLLTVGKYLTPSLFVRYGLGLFDSQSKVAVDYDLTDTLKLQAESGEHQSLDLTYSIER